MKDYKVYKVTAWVPVEETFYIKEKSPENASYWVEDNYDYLFRRLDLGKIGKCNIKNVTLAKNVEYDELFLDYNAEDCCDDDSEWEDDSIYGEDDNEY